MTPKPASTVVLLREVEQSLETLLLLRNTTLAFNGGAWVFPGGKIDPCDYPSPDAHEYEAARCAVVRETREEAGIDIVVDDLLHIAHWTTPPGQSRRYSTWFFVCPLRQPCEIVVDASEILDYRWIRPAQALAAADAGELRLPHPTRITLETLQAYTTLTALDAGLRSTQVHVFPPDSEFYSLPAHLCRS